MKKTKLILATLTIMFVALLCSTVEAQAALQANSDTNYKSENIKKPAEWMSGFRQMEEKGGGMGLSETQGTDLTSTSGSNSIDVHMMRATEYGAIAILSSSGYGNSKTLQNSTTKTTTGNKTGIYFSGSNYEWVAGGLNGSIFSGTNKIYYDTYTTERSSARVGDALGETTNNGCQGWHSASNSFWVGSSYPYFLRGDGGLFSFDDYGASGTYWGRGVAVVGAGL